MKVLHKIFNLITILIVLALGFGAFKVFLKYRSTPLKNDPRPYLLDKTIYIDDPSVAQSDVLLIGDSFATKFSTQVETLVELSSKGLKSPLSVYSVAEDHENIFRTLNKLKAQKKLPSTIIYLGGTSEFYEALYPSNLLILEQNLKRYKNDFLSSLIVLYPELSKLFFLKDQDLILGSEIKKETYNDDIRFQKLSAANYFFFKESLENLIDYIQDNNSNLILVTAPINLELEPVKVCSNSIVDEIVIEQNEIKKLIDAQKFKEAQLKLKSLLKVSIGNAYTKYLEGLLAFKTAKYQEAKDAFKLARALDCTDRGANIVINEIIRQVAIQKDVMVVDYENIINDQFGSDILFLNGDSPQFIKWDVLTKKLAESIREALQI